MESAVKRIPSLDGFRTISIALVVLGHLLHVIGFGSFGNFGNLGVRIFFVISGFLITGLLVSEIERTSSIGLLKFYFRRTLRIFPPFYFYLFVLILASLIGAVAIPASSFAASALYLTDYINPVSWNLGHTWSLSVEEQFYLLLPGVLLLFGIKRSKIILILVVALLPFTRVLDFQLWGDSHWILKGFHTNMDALAIGCLLTLFRTSLHSNPLYRRFLASRIVILLPLFIIAFNLLYDHPKIYLGLSISAMNICIALLLDWAVTNSDSVFGKALNTAPMVTLGGMSYSIYLWQQPFFDPDSHSIITTFPINFIGTAVMALISYYLVEKTALRLRKIWETKLFGEPTADNLIASEKSAA